MPREPRIHPTQAHLPLSHLSRAAAAARSDVLKFVQHQPVEYGSPIGLDPTKRFHGKIYEDADPFISGSTQNRYRFYGVKGTQADGWLDRDSAALLLGNMFDYESRQPMCVAFDCRSLGCVAVVSCLSDGFLSTLSTIATLRPSRQGGVDLEVIFRSSETHARFNAVKGPVMRVLERWGLYPFVPPTTRSAAGQSYTPRMPSAQDQDQQMRFLGAMGTGSGVAGPVSDLRRDETQYGRRWQPADVDSHSYDSRWPGADHTRSRPPLGDAGEQHRHGTFPFDRHRDRPPFHDDDRTRDDFGERVRDRDRDRPLRRNDQFERDRPTFHDDDRTHDHFGERVRDRDRDRPLRRDDQFERDRPTFYDDDRTRDRFGERVRDRDEHSPRSPRRSVKERDNAGDRSERSDYHGSRHTHSLSPLRKDVPARSTWNN